MINLADFIVAANQVGLKTGSHPTVVNNVLTPVATITALKAITVTLLASGTMIYVINPGRIYEYNPSSTLTADNYDYVAPTVGLGNWQTVVYSGGTQASQTQYTTSTTFTLPMPRIIAVAPTAAAQLFTLPALTQANGFNLNDVLIIYNVGGYSTGVANNSGTVIVSALLTPALVILKITALGTPGTLQIISQFNPMAYQAVPTWFSQTAATVLTNINAISAALLAQSNGVATLDNNGLLVPGEFPALTGDVTTAAGHVATVLATVNNNPGSVGGAGLTLLATVNNKGLITALAAAAIAIASSQITDKNSAGGVAGLDGSAHLLAALFPALTGDVTTSAGSLATTLATISPTTYTPAGNYFPVVTVNTKGLVTSVAGKYISRPVRIGAVNPDTMLLSDQGGWIDFTDNTNVTTTLPLNSTLAFDIGAVIWFYNRTNNSGNSGAFYTVIILPATGVTINAGVTIYNHTTPLTLTGPYGVQLIQTSLNNWTLMSVTPIAGIINTTWQGPFTAAQSGTIHYTRDAFGVRLLLPSITGSTSSASLISSTVALPSYLQPITGCNSLVSVVQSGTNGNGLFSINGSGVIIIGADANNSNFTAGTTCGFNNPEVAYPLI